MAAHYAGLLHEYANSPLVPQLQKPNFIAASAHDGGPAGQHVECGSVDDNRRAALDKG